MHIWKKECMEFLSTNCTCSLSFLAVPKQKQSRNITSNRFPWNGRVLTITAKTYFYIYIFFFLGNPNKIDKEYNPLKLFIYIIFSEPLLLYSAPQQSVHTHPQFLLIPQKDISFKPYRTNEWQDCMIFLLQQCHQ